MTLRFLKTVGWAFGVLLVLFAGLILITQGSGIGDDRIWWPDLERVERWWDKPWR
jgi:hypothetical protein